jgi:hypothetical protein
MNWTVLAALWVFLVFNLPVVLLLARLPFVANLGEALKEKNPIGGSDDTTSYSRVTGMIGAVILTGFFWAIGNVVLFKAFTSIADIQPLVAGVAQLFLIGAALFLPYAFNQIKAAVGASRIAAAALTGPATVAPAVPASQGPTMNITVANLSSAVDDQAFAAAVAAIAIQASRDFQPAWGTGARLTPKRLDLNGATANINAATDAIVYLGDSSNDPTSGTAGAYGYHSTNYGQLPYAFVYLDVCAQAAEPWTMTLSHEVLELLADPMAVTMINGPAPAGVGAPGQTVQYNLEVCDPTQGDSYKINGVTVSNFVTKAYFGLAGGAGPTNFLNLPLASFGVRPNGYYQYEDSNGAQQVNGPEVSAQRIAARTILKSLRRNARRAEGMELRV